jgi:hypothetical protein
MIGGAAGELPEYDIEINGDGIVDYTLTINAGLGSIWQFNIVPKGNNSVLAYVDRASPNRAKPCGTGLGSTWV